MRNNLSSQWKEHDREVIACRKCPRLVTWREEVAEKKRRAFIHAPYWGKPVPGFGDPNARVMILGLAPGAHGSNRTGRMFTGDASGDFLFPALHRAGFASQAESTSPDDGLMLSNIYITAVCRCAPPGNKPTREEQKTCLPYAVEEIQMLENLQGIVALGGIAFRNAVDLLTAKYGHLEKPRPKFGHHVFYRWTNCPFWLLAAYHPSQQNTQTGRLTEAMFAEIWETVKGKLEEKE